MPYKGRVKSVGWLFYWKTLFILLCFFYRRLLVWLRPESRSISFRKNEWKSGEAHVFPVTRTQIHNTHTHSGVLREWGRLAVGGSIFWGPGWPLGVCIPLCVCIFLHALLERTCREASVLCFRLPLEFKSSNSAAESSLCFTVSSKQIVVCNYRIEHINMVEMCVCVCVCVCLCLCMRAHTHTHTHTHTRTHTHSQLEEKIQWNALSGNISCLWTQANPLASIGYF